MIRVFLTFVIGLVIAAQPGVSFAEVDLQEIEEIFRSKREWIYEEANKLDRIHQKPCSALQGHLTQNQKVYDEYSTRIKKDKSLKTVEKKKIRAILKKHQKTLAQNKKFISRCKKGFKYKTIAW
jgi:hypothetical protein